LKSIGNLYQTGDWKGEKHVPVIHAPETANKDEYINVKVLIGEEIPHPNTLEHHIQWVKVYFHPEGSKFPVEVANADFSAHGELGVYTDYCVEFKFKADKSGTLYATSYCNIHGLWENSMEITIAE
jgi:superoxide reductase